MVCESWQSVLSQCFGEVLEEVAFVFTEPGETSDSPSQGVTAKLVFNGPESGVLALCIDAACAEEIAENFLGDPSFVTEESVQDVVKELLNIVAGIFVARTLDVGLTTLHPPDPSLGDAAYKWTSMATDEGWKVHCGVAR